MNVDIFDNRISSKVIKGDILETQILPNDGSKEIEHLCITLNTGFNVLIELSTIKTINRYLVEQGVEVE